MASAERRTGVCTMISPTAAMVISTGSSMFGRTTVRKLFWGSEAAGSATISPQTSRPAINPAPIFRALRIVAILDHSVVS